MILNFKHRTAPFLRKLSLLRSYHAQFKLEPTAPFDISIKLPFSVHLAPVENTDAQNTVTINLQGEGTVLYSNKSNRGTIYSAVPLPKQETVAHVKVPFNSNVKVFAMGDITTEFYIGENVTLHSKGKKVELGRFKGKTLDVVVNNGNFYQNDSVEAVSYKAKIKHNGNIVLKGPVHAKKIEFDVEEKGSIQTQKLQGNEAEIETKTGDISVRACYVGKSKFETNCGNVEMASLHGSSEIKMNMGKLSIKGLDGDFNFKLRNTTADIQIERLSGNSSITHTEEGEVKLRISDEVEENNCLELKKPGARIDDTITMYCDKDPPDETLWPHQQRQNKTLAKLIVDCVKLSIIKGSWTDMFNIKKIH